MKKKISIHDIATQLNISATTISFVLNGKAEEKRISSDMKKKILKYVQKVGYQPNMIAKSLRTGRSNIIGMLVEDISDPFFASIARGVEELAYRLGYKVFFLSTENETQKTKTLIRVLRERQVDGYIIAPPTDVEDDIRSLMNDNLPVILFDRYFPDVETNNVMVDNFGGAYGAVQHFVENGYSNIGLVTLDSKQNQMLDRLKGYNKVISEKGLTKRVEKISYYANHEQKVEAIKHFVIKNPELDAILFATNYLAIGGLEAIHSLHLQIPQDIAIVGFDDNTHFSLFSPSITSVAQPVDEISTTVIKCLITSMSGEENGIKKETITLPVKLIVRESSLAVSEIDIKKYL